MPTFIEKSCCKGSRPAGVVGPHHNLRSSITGAMLRERGVPRFLVAPTGYGKSSCAYEYAQVVFGFDHVFWIKCDSPCFLRDLDEGSISSQIAAADPMAKLVVFDDVPRLDQGREGSFDDLLRDLMGAGIEIIVACVPSVDVVSSLHADKVLLRAMDLVPSEDEVEIECMRGNKTHEEAKMLVPPRGAACLLWDDGGSERILKGLTDEELPSELELSIFCMLALGTGRIDDLAGIIARPRLLEDAMYLASMFPYLGIDLDAGTFASIDVSPADILECSKFSPSLLGKASLEGERDLLAMSLGNMLLRKGDGIRAADTVRALATRAGAATWVTANGWELLSHCWALSVEDLASIARPTDASSKDALNALRSWALAMLGDKRGCAKVSSRIIGSSSADWWELAAAAIAPCALGDYPRRHDIETIVARAKAAKSIPSESGVPSPPSSQSFLCWETMLELEGARGEHGDMGAYVDCFAEKAKHCTGSVKGDGSSGVRNALMVSGAWFLERQTALLHDLQKSEKGEDEARFVELATTVVSFLSHELMLTRDGRTSTWHECVAANALQAIDERFPYAFAEGVSPKIISRARSMAVRLMMQSDEHRKRKSRRDEAKGEYELTHEDAFRAKAQPASKIASLRVATPSLVISLFGGAEVWIGTDRSDPRQIKRKNAKIVLAMLALNKGREITKDRIASALWPEAPADNARQNLYVVWSYLKKSLKVGSSCPYLISTQTGYKLDSRFVVSDFQRFEELCRDLLFGRDDKETWEELYAKVSGDFAEDLLPEITDNAYIDGVRKRLQTQMVDGLVEASGRMLREGETRGGIWFAREALRRDCSREDAYIALMEAQIASNQRGAALDTYFECRRYLSEQLGIDPSCRVVELYRSVIETEEDF